MIKFAALMMLLVLMNVNLGNSQYTEADLNNDLEEITMIKRRSKLVACMSILKNSLNDGNNSFKEALDRSAYDRSKSFDKLVVSILKSCETNIKDKEMETTLTPENILNPLKNDATLLRLVNFDKNVLSAGVALTEEEKQVLQDINESSQSIDTDVTIQDEEIGFMGFKLSQTGRMAYVFVSIAVLLVLVIIFGGLYAVMCKKKEDKKKKNK
jgi:hypothetical protein